jgi:AP2 domain
MKNKYEVRGETTAIIIESRKYGRIETIIDTEDLPKVSEASSWRAHWRDDTKSFYAYGYITDENGKHRSVQMHRHVLGLTDPDKQVDHVEHDTLDNRKSKLNVVTTAENCQNRRKFSTNTSGYTGVTWDKSRGKWVASIVVNYKRKNLGRYDDKDEAIRARRAAEYEYFHYKRKIS